MLLNNNMINIPNDENNIIIKKEKDLDNPNLAGSPEGTIKHNSKSKKCLPSFFFENIEKDDYFKEQNSNCDNESNEEKDTNDINLENNLSENGEEEKVPSFDQLKIFDSQNKNNMNNSDYQKHNSYFNENKNKEEAIINNGINYNINGNLSNQNYAINFEKNFFSNSFNNRNSNYYYQNYFNVSNSNNLNPNILNSLNNSDNNVNIINNNTFINNQSMNPFSNSFGPIYPFNSLNFQHYFSGPIKSDNSSDGFNNFNYLIENKNNVSNNDIDKNCFSLNLPFSSIEQKNENISYEKKKKKKKKNKANDENTNNDLCINIKKLLNMTDNSLYNYLITQKGSREVQTALKKIKENEVEILINKLENYISDITIDKYGNYFSQKLIQICIPSQRMKIMKFINKRFTEISNNSYGTHPLQTLMEIINMPEEKKLALSYILGNESTLSLDSKGTHVLQKFISNTVDEEREELNKNIINLIEKLIIDPFGVCVLIKLVKHTKDKTISEKIAKYITDNGPLSFIQHPYANYAVQILLNSTDLSNCEYIIETIVNNYLSLSMQKFSSNVVENCIKYGDEATVKKIYNSIFEQEKLDSLLNNNYGNFVLEKLIARLNKEEKSKIIKKIEKLGKTKNLSNTLRNLLYE